MRDNLLFVDTETSGVPDSVNAHIAHLHNWPFVLQVAWQIYDRSGELVKTENHYIWEEEIFIEKSSIKIHGITKSDLKAKGKSRKAVMKLLINDLRAYKPIIVGHFVEFDSKMLQVALIRCGLSYKIKKHRHFCTMRASTEYTRFPNHDYPQLRELYMALFKEDMQEEHDASVDAAATARCFFELLHRGDVTEEMLNNQPLFAKVKDEMKRNTGCGLPVLLIILAIVYILL